ncbi:hypothetical protein J5N97_002936 [Dioscorea zingiberensis]|uniref:Uncharacterized protein n=1 Tax=Dioscorea zingiberensis TaxID=325984 RepID=A0A9D5D5R8_9LILI|nr:hypothetical protein J5N97_002936 [Dioscorea zingiberensis]
MAAGSLLLLGHLWVLQEAEDWQLVSLSPEICTKEGSKAGGVAEGRQRKRRRTRSLKNKEESDQASIIGGAINFVKELEQLHQSLEAQKLIKQRHNNADCVSAPFTNHFTFPQYSSTTSCNTDGIAVTTSSSGITNETTAERRLANADIEVTMVEGHANLKILAKRRRSNC